MKHIGEDELARQVGLAAREVENRMRAIEFTNIEERLDWLKKSKAMELACREYLEYYEGSFEQKDEYRPMRLPEYAWPGGYPVVYFERKTNDPFCADCAVERFGPTTDTGDMEVPNIDYYVEEEGDPPGDECAGGCGRFIGYGAEDGEIEGEDYQYIRKWEMMIRSNEGWMRRQLELARDDNAPQNAIYKTTSGWRTTDDIKNPDIREAWSLDQKEDQ